MCITPTAGRVCAGGFRVCAAAQRRCSTPRYQDHCGGACNSAAAVSGVSDVALPVWRARFTMTATKQKPLHSKGQPAACLACRRMCMHSSNGRDAHAGASWCVHASVAPRAPRCAHMRMRRVGVLKYVSPAHEHDVPRQLWRRQRWRLFFSPDAFRDYFGEQVRCMRSTSG